MFWKKPNETQVSSPNPIHSAEYEDLVKRISAGAGKIATIEITLEAIKTDLANLRGKFSARLKGLKSEEEEQKKAEEFKTETVNNTEFVAFG